MLTYTLLYNESWAVICYARQTIGGSVEPLLGWIFGSSFGRITRYPRLREVLGQGKSNEEFQELG